MTLCAPETKKCAVYHYCQFIYSDKVQENININPRKIPMPGNRCKGNRGGRRQRVMRFLQPCLLLMLTRGAAHGYSLLDGIDEFGFQRECFDASLIYRALRDMEDFGWVESQWQDESQGPRRRVYQILPDGEKRLSEWIDELHRTRDEIDALIAAYKQVHPIKVS